MRTLVFQDSLELITSRLLGACLTQEGGDCARKSTLKRQEKDQAGCRETDFKVKPLWNGQKLTR